MKEQLFLTSYPSPSETENTMDEIPDLVSDECCSYRSNNDSNKSSNSSSYMYMLETSSFHNNNSNDMLLMSSENDIAWKKSDIVKSSSDVANLCNEGITSCPPDSNDSNATMKGLPVSGEDIWEENDSPNKIITLKNFDKNVMVAHKEKRLATTTVQRLLTSSNNEFSSDPSKQIIVAVGSTEDENDSSSNVDENNFNPNEKESAQILLNRTDTTSPNRTDTTSPNRNQQQPYVEREVKGYKYETTDIDEMEKSISFTKEDNKNTQRKLNNADSKTQNQQQHIEQHESGTTKNVTNNDETGKSISFTQEDNEDTQRKSNNFDSETQEQQPQLINIEEYESESGTAEVIKNAADNDETGKSISFTEEDNKDTQKKSNNFDSETQKPHLNIEEYESEYGTAEVTKNAADNDETRKSQSMDQKQQTYIETEVDSSDVGSSEVTENVDKNNVKAKLVNFAKNDNKQPQRKSSNYEPNFIAIPGDKIDFYKILSNYIKLKGHNNQRVLHEEDNLYEKDSQADNNPCVMNYIVKEPILQVGEAQFSVLATNKDFIVPLFNSYMYQLMENRDRLRAIALKNKCCITVHKRILNRRVYTGWYKYMIININGPVTVKVDNVDKAIYQIFEWYRQRKTYFHKAHCVFYLTESIPDNSVLVFQDQKTGPRTTQFGALRLDNRSKGGMRITSGFRDQSAQFTKNLNERYFTNRGHPRSSASQALEIIDPLEEKRQREMYESRKMKKMEEFRTGLIEIRQYW